MKTSTSSRCPPVAATVPVRSAFSANDCLVLDGLPMALFEIQDRRWSAAAVSHKPPDLDGDASDRLASLLVDGWFPVLLGDDSLVRWRIGGMVDELPFTAAAPRATTILPRLLAFDTCECARAGVDRPFHLTCDNHGKTPDVGTEFSFDLDSVSACASAVGAALLEMYPRDDPFWDKSHVRLVAAEAALGILCDSGYIPRVGEDPQDASRCRRMTDADWFVYRELAARGDPRVFRAFAGSDFWSEVARCIALLEERGKREQGFVYAHLGEMHPQGLEVLGIVADVALEDPNLRGAVVTGQFPEGELRISSRLRDRSVVSRFCLETFLGSVCFQSCFGAHPNGMMGGGAVNCTFETAGVQRVREALFGMARESFRIAA